MKTKAEIGQESVVGLLVDAREEDLAAVWAQLNTWKWPDVLPEDLKPYWWDGHKMLTRRQVREKKSGFIDAVNSYIETRVTEEQISEAWEEATRGS